VGKETEVHRLTDILVEEVSLVDRAANKRKFLVVKRDDAAEKAVWSTAFVNNLPDSAFLYVEPGGKTDAEGLTVPRSLRHFPVRGPDGKVDLPHLRNAIARIPQAMFLSSEQKDRLQAEARRMLSAQKELTKMSTELLPDGNGGFTTVEEEVVPAAKAEHTPAEMTGFQLPPGAKAILSPLMRRACDQCTALADAIDGSTEVELPEEGPVPLVPVEFWTALTGVIDIFRQIDSLFPTKPQMPEDAPEEMAGDEAEAAQAATEAEPVEARCGSEDHMAKTDVAKAGAKMSKDRYARFEQALATLGAILTELKPMQQAQQAAPMAKNLEGTVARMADMVSNLTGIVQTQGNELATLRKARGVGNALAPEASPRYDEEHVSWPLDMNSPVTRDGVNKTESFFD
jgi:hypothetical protein